MGSQYWQAPSCWGRACGRGVVSELISPRGMGLYLVAGRGLHISDCSWLRAYVVCCWYIRIHSPLDTSCFRSCCIVIPTRCGYLTAACCRKGIDWFRQCVHDELAPVTAFGLIITLVCFFAFQGEVILNNPLHMSHCPTAAIQTFLIFFSRLWMGQSWRVPPGGGFRSLIVQ